MRDRDLIRYATGRSSLGDVFAAVSDAGLVAFELGGGLAAKVAGLVERFPGADVVADQPGLAALIEKLAHLVEHPASAPDVPLDLRGTPYELGVWSLLREIPAGMTTSYGALAARLGTRDARDVTAAIAANPVAILVPCHRVVKKDGSISGYRWGVARKRTLLERERAGSGAAAP